MLSPASLPAIMPPLPVSDTPSPPSLPVAPPPFSSPPSALPAMSPTVPLPINIAPPVPSPAHSIAPVLSPPSPRNFPFPAASPPVMSQVSPYPPVLSPQTSKASPPPAASHLPPPFPFPQPHPSRKSPPLSPLPTTPRVTFPPPSTPPTLPKSPISQVTFPPKSPGPRLTSPPKSSVPQVTSPAPPVTKSAPGIPPPLPTLSVPSATPHPSSSAATPTPLQTPLLPALAPESQLPFAPESKLPSSDSSTTPMAQPPSSSAGSLPVAVEFQKPLAFHMSTGLIIGLVIGGSILLVFVLGILCLLCRDRKKKKHDLRSHYYEETSNAGLKGSHVIKVQSSSTKLQPYLTEGSGACVSANLEPMNPISNRALSIACGHGSVNGTFTYDELAVATNSFSEANLLGQGGFGYVYKGILRSGKEIAVKQLKTGSQQGEREFQAEVETISRVHHKHLVELVGYCVNKAERLLVYEYVPNNTLEYHLHGEGRSVMEWETRMKVALGSGKGLTYLHEDCNPAIIHRDIKASNMLLDFGFEAKVSDFGLAKIFPNTSTCVTHITTRVVGTFGYLAPEYAASGILTEKSDVYSYGVMLLELITGRPPINEVDSSRNESLVDWARPLLSQALQDGCLNKLVDPRLQNNYKVDEMTRMITCAAACVRQSARLRPRMSQIVGALEGLVSLTDLVGDIIPGNTTLFSWSGSLNYDVNQYRKNIGNFNLALSSPKHSSFSAYSENTSDHGLHPSDSSTSSFRTYSENTSDHGLHPSDSSSGVK